MSPRVPRPLSPQQGILFGGLVAGALDITYAMVRAHLQGRSAIGAVKAVASGILGVKAFQGGNEMFVLGLALHFLIACSAAGIYLLASRRIPLLRERLCLPGALFGVGVYLVMNFVVLPLSAVPFKLSYPPLTVAAGLLVHIFLIGLPIAYFAGRVR
ncbi:MAG: hypothetical protein KDD47_07735 [Acidobacteria bacterium]|nr:hypothetical protein [Acidobacteriota bacterium]